MSQAVPSEEGLFEHLDFQSKTEDAFVLTVEDVPRGISFQKEDYI